MTSSPRPGSDTAVQTFVTACGRLLTGDARYSPQAVYRGKTIHFCTEACLDAFREDPQGFLKTHTRKEAA
jgi:YHS domain-containing protein